MYNPETIEINGKQAIVLVPELVNELAVVDLNVVKRLAALLPTANLRAIKEEFTEKLRSATTMEQYVAILRDELSFHETVNLITTIKLEKKSEEVEQRAVKQAYPMRES
jgi:hypothetical protein